MRLYFLGTMPADEYRPQHCLSQMMQAILFLIKPLGDLLSQRLYFDSSQQQHLQLPFHDSIQNDFHLIDCPSNKRQSPLEKMLADVLGFAWQRVNRQIPACVVLVTDDPEFSYLLSKLNEIGVQTILIHSHFTQTSDLLLDCCDQSFSREEIFCEYFDILDIDLSSDCDSDRDDDEEEEEPLFGENICSVDEEAFSFPMFISPSDLVLDNHLPDNPHPMPWLSDSDPILEESSSLLDSSSSIFSHFKGFTDHSFPPSPPPFLSGHFPSMTSGSGSYDLWQSRPSSDLFYLLHSSCFPSSG
jgi:hypothetical protein